MDRDRCRCCDAPLGDTDHCPVCGCEEYEEDPGCGYNKEID